MARHCYLILLVAFIGAVYGQTTMDPFEDLLYGILKDSKGDPSVPERQNPCSSWACFSGGECMWFGDSVWCSCRPGYTGGHCERKENACQGYCFNGGTCEMILDLAYPYCQCPAGFLGTRCETVDLLNGDWAMPSQASNPNWNNDLSDIDKWPIPTIPSFPDEWLQDNSEEYIEDDTVAWIAPTTIVAILVLGSLYGVIHYLVRQRRRRRLILIRTVQVSVEENPARAMPPSLRQGRYSGLSRSPIRCLSPRIPQGVVIPSEFESEAAHLVSPAPLMIAHDGPTGVPRSTQSSTAPSVITTGAPPPYAEVAPQEGGQSADEPPPPYPGP